MGKYKTNFLTKVVAKVDFANPIPVEDKLEPELTKSILKSFPISEPKKLIGTQVKFVPDEGFNFEGEQLSKTEWNYYGKNREKQLIVASEAFTIIYDEYDSFETLLSEFLDNLTILSKIYPDLQMNRLGLRYVNEIKLNEPHPLEWNEYLDEKLLTIFDVSEDRTKIARGFHDLAINYDDMILGFKYGVHNPDFPAPIKKKIFVLDYDAYFHGFQELTDVGPNLKIFHRVIEDMFESNIKEGLREVMNAE